MSQTDNLSPEDLVKIATTNKIKMQEKRLQDCIRISAKYQLYHQHCGENPTVIEFSYSTLIETKEEEDQSPYTRPRLMVREDTVLEMDLGWLQTVGEVVIENLIKPSLIPEEKLLTDKQTIELMVGDTVFGYIRAGRFAHFEPADIPNISFRSMHGNIPIRLTAMPG